VPALLPGRMPVVRVQDTTRHGATGTTGAHDAGLRPPEAWRASAAVCHAYRGKGLGIWVGVSAVSDGLGPGQGAKVPRGTCQGEAHRHGQPGSRGATAIAYRSSIFLS
jgi:hypothetical protein